MSNESENENENENEIMQLLRAVNDGVDHVIGKYDINEDDPNDLSITWDNDTFFVAYLPVEVAHAIHALFQPASE